MLAFDTTPALSEKVPEWSTILNGWNDIIIHNCKVICESYHGISRSSLLNVHELTRQIWGIWKLRPSYSPETPNLGQNRWCFVSCDLEIWWMTLENNRASLLCYFKLCATFHSHRWIQTGVTVRKWPIWVKLDDFFSRVTLKFDRLHWNTIGYLFSATSSFVHHLVAICEFKLELQSGNAQFGSKSTIFLVVWPCNLTYDLEKTIGHLFYVASSFVHHFITIGEFKLELQSGNTQSGSNLSIFLAIRPWNLTDDLIKQ